MPTPHDLPTLSLFNMSLVSASQDAAVSVLLDGSRRRVAFVNADCVNQAAGDHSYREALSEMDVLLPDGSGLALAASFTGRKFESNLNGTDLFPLICAEALRTGKSIYFLGGKPGVAQSASTKALSEFPGLQIAGYENGYFDEADEPGVIARINASNADILLVAMGAPNQEKFINRNSDALSVPVCLGVGGLFDFVAGNVPRAPKSLRKIGMEWAWRMACEPRRLAKRYLIGNPVFIARAVVNALPRKLDGHGIAKRALDLLISGTALVILFPLFFATALAVRAESKGTAFFTQTRIGRDGRRFEMIKFRSMHTDAEERLASIRANSDRDDVCFKMTKDPRVTGIGRILRSTSLDELPQLINVFKGEMSMVGPRPALPVEVNRYSTSEAERLNGVPGITCLWQISGRADLKFDKQVDLDVAYLRSRSLLLDIAIMLLTPLAIISRRGAY